jgi:alanine racemase
MSEHRCWTEISLGSIAHNYHRLREAAAGAEVVCVVKADAYRHGANEVAARLAEEGARWFAVANTAEGVALRQSGLLGEILVLGGILDFEFEPLFRYRLTPVVHDTLSLPELDRQASARGTLWPFHLKIDTGMGRMGSRASALLLAEAVRAAPHLRLEGIMSHLATTGEQVTPQTRDQLDAFERVTAELAALGIAPSLRHTAATLPLVHHHSHSAALGSMVRPGLGLYGYPSSHMKPALSWKSRVVLVKQIAAGEPVGYGARWRAHRPSRIAVVACGYADGVPHRLGNDAYVLLNGGRAPIRGAVSMDLLTVDATDSAHVEPGDVATLIGTDGGISITAEHWSEWSATIPYVILCGIGLRVGRVYLP